MKILDLEMQRRDFWGGERSGGYGRWGRKGFKCFHLEVFWIGQSRKTLLSSMSLFDMITECNFPTYFHSVLASLFGGPQVPSDTPLNPKLTKSETAGSELRTPFIRQNDQPWIRFYTRYHNFTILLYIRAKKFWKHIFIKIVLPDYFLHKPVLLVHALF